MSVFRMTTTTLRNLFGGPVTRRYPARVKEPHHAARTRGHIHINIEACIFCSACSKRCPTDAITVSKTEKVWEIDRLRCCTCNACVEVCPRKCLDMAVSYTLPTVTKDHDVFKQPPKPPKPESPTE